MSGLIPLHDTMVCITLGEAECFTNAARSLKKEEEKEEKKEKRRKNRKLGYNMGIKVVIIICCNYVYIYIILSFGRYMKVPVATCIELSF